MLVVLPCFAGLAGLERWDGGLATVPLDPNSKAALQCVGGLICSSRLIDIELQFQHGILAQQTAPLCICIATFRRVSHHTHTSYYPPLRGH